LLCAESKSAQVWHHVPKGASMVAAGNRCGGCGEAGPLTRDCADFREEKRPNLANDQPLRSTTVHECRRKLDAGAFEAEGIGSIESSKYNPGGNL
jgi:hypothetical protein